VTVKVTQPPVNSLPVPKVVGPEGLVRPESEVVLDGSTSSDSDGFVVDFSWKCISHPTLSFTGQNSSYITFTLVDTGDYTFTLSVEDNLGDWSADVAYFTVSVRVNLRPVANITGPSTGVPGVNITLSGEPSEDPDGTVVAWKWEIPSHPGLVMNGSNETEMTFMPERAENHTVSLVVQDNEDIWSTAVEWVIVVEAIDQPPEADAGPDRNVRVGGSVELNGGDSYDMEGDIVAWKWRCTSHSNVPGFINDDMMMASFTPPGPGVYRFTLEVQDEIGQWSDPDEVMITVLEENQKPVVTIIKPSGGTVTLDGHLLHIEWQASDPNGDQLAFTVEVYKGMAWLARLANLPHGTTSHTFNDTSFNFPRETDLEVRVTARETGTEDRYTVTATSNTFQIVDKPGDGNGGGDEDDNIGLTYGIIGIIIIIVIILAVAMASRGGVGPAEDELPWDDEDEPVAKKTSTSKRGAMAAGASAVATKPKAAAAAAKDPKGRLLDCPTCGAPLDYDNDFARPYCWDCDKYF
jgi:hypothetical protein